MPTIACLNGHPSLLPRYRGPVPVAWAVHNGETEIGFSYHVMDEEFDTGAILAQTAVPLDDDDDDFETLWPKLGAACRELLPSVFERLARGGRGEPHEGGDYQSLFDDDYAFVRSRTVRAGRPHPGQGVAFRAHRQSERGPLLERDSGRVRLLRTSLTEVEGAERLDCADGPLRIVETEPAD